MKPAVGVAARSSVTTARSESRSVCVTTSVSELFVPIDLGPEDPTRMISAACRAARTASDSNSAGDGMVSGTSDHDFGLAEQFKVFVADPRVGDEYVYLVQACVAIRLVVVEL